MYDLWFYGFYWVAGFLLAFPVLIIGFVYAHLKPPPPPPKTVSFSPLTLPPPAQGVIPVVPVSPKTKNPLQTYRTRSKT